MSVRRTLFFVFVGLSVVVLGFLGFLSRNEVVVKGGGNRCALLIYGVRMSTLRVGGSSVRKNVVEALQCDVFVFGREEEGAIEAIRGAFGPAQLKGVFLGPQLEQDEILSSIRGGPRFSELHGVCKDSNMLRFVLSAYVV